MIPIILMMLVMGVGDDFCPGDLMICSVSCWMFACQPLQRWLRQADRFISIVASTLASYIYISFNMNYIEIFREHMYNLYMFIYIISHHTYIYIQFKFISSINKTTMSSPDGNPSLEPRSPHALVAKAVILAQWRW